MLSTIFPLVADSPLANHPAEHGIDLDVVLAACPHQGTGTLSRFTTPCRRRVPGRGARDFIRAPLHRNPFFKGNLPLETAHIVPDTFAVRWNKVTVVGVGLLGGSLGLALRQGRLAKHVAGYVRREASLAECLRLKVADSATLDLATAVRDSDLIVLCTPLAQMPSLVAQMQPDLKSGAIITDVGSVKASVVRQLQALARPAGAEFVGSHPMAGSEKTGMSASRADVFQGAVCVVTPTAHTRPKALRTVKALWEAVGARVLTMSAAEHDLLVSRSSHLPHLLAAEIAGFVLRPTMPEKQAMLCANGFRDVTRIASGSPEMWRDIAMANRSNLSRGLKQIIRDLERLRLALDAGDSPRIQQFLEHAKQLRDAWIQQGTSPSLE